MTRIVALASALATAAGLLVVVPVVAMIGVLFGASANNACVDPAALTASAGGPIRVPIAASWSTTSEWGMRRHPIRGDYSHHYGLDFTGSSRVVSAAAGVVAATPTTGGEGNQIVVDHGGGIRTKYKHLAVRAVKTGDPVWAGRRIGTMGSTGSWSTGRHLHFEVWSAGKDIDPRTWLKISARRGTGAPAAAQGAAGVGTVTPIDHSRISTGGTPANLIDRMPAAVGSYKRRQLVNAGRIIKAGQAMDLDARTITIGVMTAMGESSLVNVDRGDAAGPDSRGLFQQRSGGAWGSYSDRMNPQIAAKHFFKALLKVPGYRSLAPTIAAHRTQRNADPNHYARYWPVAVKIVATLTADPTLLASLAVDVPYSGCESVNVAADMPAGDGSGQAIVSAAKGYLGTPYSWGGGTTSGPSRGIRTSASLDGSHTVGFDCSGLVMFAVHHATGLTLPRTAGGQGLDSRGATIPRNYTRMRPGDVIAFSTTGSRSPGAFEHVGIYLGAGQMIHAPRPGKSVEITQLKGNRYYESQTWAIKRYSDN